jgi:excisionase family DNA binding protein
MRPAYPVVTCLSTGRTAVGAAEWEHGAMPGNPRFLTLTDVAEILNTSSAQVYALVRRGELPAIKLGGRGQWRIERDRLEEFISGLYRDTQQFVSDHPFVDADAVGDGSDADR